MFGSAGVVSISAIVVSAVIGTEVTLWGGVTSGVGILPINSAACSCPVDESTRSPSSATAVLTASSRAGF